MAPSSPNGDSRWAAKWEWSWRRFTAAVLLTGLVAAAFVSALTPHLRVSEPSPADPARTIQRPLGYSDAAVGLAVLLIVGLMLPDVRRVRISPTDLDLSLSDADDLPKENEELDVKGTGFKVELSGGGEQEPGEGGER